VHSADEAVVPLAAPVVSVIVPTRNRWPFLQVAVASVLAQEDVDLELIVVDDGSTDETAQRLADVDDPRLHVVKRVPPHGVARARNAGIAVARGEWLAFLDDDDLWAPTKLRVQLDAAEAAGAGFAYTGTVHLDKSRTRVVHVAVVPEPDDLVGKLLVHNVVPGGCSNVIVRADVVRRVGGFDERLAELADWDLWVRSAAVTTAAMSPEPLVGYLEHEQNMLFRDKPRVSREVAYLREKHEAARQERGVRLDAGYFRRWIGYQYRRAGRAHRDEGRRVVAARHFLRAGMISPNPLDFARAGVALVGDRALLVARHARRLVRPGPVWSPPVDQPPEGPSWLDPYR
jgi:glycosyltransferase involved in cell wall biosynthesis